MRDNKPELLKTALNLALAAGRIQMKYWGSNLKVNWKGVTDPVTKADKECEKTLVEILKKKWPEHAILGEEDGAQGNQDSQTCWIIDPLDGTVNYSHGLPLFSVSIGVVKNGVIQTAVVHAPALGETFSAVKGQGAFLNGKKIRVSSQKKPLNSLLVTGFPYNTREKGTNLREWIQAVLDFQALRRLGSASLDLCWLAAGRFDALWEYGLKAWDLAAGVLIIEEAQGKVTDIAGKKFNLYGETICASNRHLHSKLLLSLSKARQSKLKWPPV
jgi:myo-inositol-1(or 4)-monophosphatase